MVFLNACISILIIVSSIDDAWHTFYVLFNLAELLVFALIISQAWKWARAENSQKADSIGHNSSPVSHF
jgi:hypothetical protein